MSSYDAFIAHCWGDDEQGRDNHERAVEIAKGLQKMGLKIWIDEQRMEGDVLGAMVNGIMTSKSIVLLVTKRYMAKVADMDGGDNCAFEFNCAYRKKKPGLMIPVVMEEGLKNPDDWEGPLLALSGKLYTRMWGNVDDASVGELAKVIRKTAGIGEPAAAPAPVVEPDVQEEVPEIVMRVILGAEGNASMKSLMSWMQGHESVVKPWFQSHALKGEPAAMTILGMMYRTGTFVPHSDETAADWYRKAALKGHARGASNLGALYGRGAGVPLDHDQAHKWCKIAADGGSPVGQYNSGLHYLYGRGVKENRSTAKKWFELSAKQGYPDAIKRLKEI